MADTAGNIQNTSDQAGSLGLGMCTALVVGNMIGSGFFIAPAALAPYGTVAIIGWGVMAFGAVCLGLVFARLARLAPATGGPYAYTRMGFGRFAGFLTRLSATGLANVTSGGGQVPAFVVNERDRVTSL